MFCMDFVELLLDLQDIYLRSIHCFRFNFTKEI